MNVKELKILLNQFPDDMPIMAVIPNGLGGPSINLSVMNAVRVHEMQGEEGMFIEYYATESQGTPALFIKGMVGVGFVDLDEKPPGQEVTGGNSAAS